MGIIAVILLVLSFIGGMQQGLVKSAFSVFSTIVSIIFAGLLYTSVGNVFSFLPEDNWEHFTGFIIVMAVFVALFTALSWMPRKAIEAMWHEGVVYRLGGAVLNLFGAAVGIVVFALLFLTFPVWSLIVDAIHGSPIMTGLISLMSFVQAFLPEVFQAAGTMV